MYRKRTCYFSGIELRKHANDIAKELLRKSIHICAAFVPLFLSFAYIPVLCALAVVLVLYCIAEYLRYTGHNIPLISDITAAAARKRDENKFVLGPVTLASGVILTALFFNPVCASLGIYALAFGDGLASLAGKFFGHVRIPFIQGKTVTGCLTCFSAIFISSFCVTKNAFLALVLGLCGMVLEMLPLKDWDNIVIPVTVAIIAQFILHIY